MHKFTPFRRCQTAILTSTILKLPLLTMQACTFLHRDCAFSFRPTRERRLSSCVRWLADVCCNRWTDFFTNLDKKQVINVSTQSLSLQADPSVEMSSNLLTKFQFPLPPLHGYQRNLIGGKNICTRQPGLTVLPLVSMCPIQACMGFWEISKSTFTPIKFYRHFLKVYISNHKLFC